jgi:DNA-directed RNA polymerase specialized sigma subunit
MIDVKNYEKLEKYIECGISKIIGKRFANQDNIDKIVAKVIKYNNNFDSSKKMAYSSYIYMIVKTSCYSIFKNSKKTTNTNRKLNSYKKYKIDNLTKDNESLMLVVDKIMNDDILSDLEKSIIEKKFLESKNIRQISEETGLSKNKINKIVSDSILKMQSSYSSIDKIKEEMEIEHGKIIN